MVLEGTPDPIATWIGLLGTVSVRDAAGAAVTEGSERQRRLLVGLGLRSGRVVTTDRLLEIVFGDDLPADPLRSLRTYLSRLRTFARSCGWHDGDAVVSEPAGYRLDVDADRVDVGRFERLVVEARSTEDLRARAETLRSALALWRGPALAEFAEEAWARPEAVRLEELRAVAIEERSDALLETGAHEVVVEELRGAVVEHPTRERLQASLMVALYRSGRQADALRAFQAHRAQLATDLGLEPSPELRRLDARIGANDPELLGRDRRRRARSYELAEVIGRGAFGLVWLGRQPGLDRQVAVKQIRAELANQAEFIRSFDTEAQLVARIEHPHVVPLYDYWREPDSAFLVMRWFRGGTLATRLDDGPLTLEECRRLVEQIGGALGAAHRLGVVHRDVKPGNILLDEDGNYFLGDFGIAREASRPREPRDGLSPGSPAYAAPEQLLGEPASPAADTYGLAVSTFEALAGQLPFHVPGSPGTSARRGGAELPSVHALRPMVPADVDVVLRSAAAVDPSDRPESVGAFVVALGAALGGQDGRIRAAPSADVLTLVPGLDGAGRNPYKGLRSFDEADAGDFFGRERLVERLLEVLRRPGPAGRLLAVVGASGGGKSSAVRAGLIPAIRHGGLDGSRDWFVTAMSPGSTPFEELEEALLRVSAVARGDLVSVMRSDPRGITRAVKQCVPDGREVCLVVDQFEELFTLTVDESTRGAFIEGLMEAVDDERSRVRVVLTMRADFTDRPLRFMTFGAAFEAATVMVTPLAPDELERAITEPARRAGVDLETGLTAEIVADVVDEPGALPLVQYALTELFDRCEHGRLAVDAYRQIGGVSGAIAHRADAIHEGFDAEHQARSRAVFSRLVTLGEGIEDTRRRALRSELPAGVVTERVLDEFGRARLLSFDRDPLTREPTVDVAHEALLREWGLLRSWIDEQRDDLRIVRHLTTVASAWQASGRDDGELYRGGRLETVREWSVDHGRDLSPLEREFLGASVARADAEVDRERRRLRRLRLTVVGVAAIAAVALIAGLVAIEQRDDARTARSAAETARLVAEAEDIAAVDRSVGLLMAVEAYRRDPSPATLGALQRVFVALPRAWLGSLSGRGGYSDVEVVGDDRIVASGPAGLDVFDLDRRVLVAAVDLEGIPSAFDADPVGDLFAVGFDDGRVTVLDADELAVVAEIGVGEPIARVAFSEEGESLAVGLASGLVEVRSTQTWQRTALIEGVGAPPADLAWRSDSARLLVAGGDGVPARQFDPSTGDQIGPELVAGDVTVGSTAVTYVGDAPLVANGPLVLFDPTTGLPMGDPVQLRAPVRGFGRVRALPDGRVITTNFGGEVTITDLATAESELVVVDGQVLPDDIELLSDDRLVVAGSEGLALWALDGTGAVAMSFPNTGNQPTIDPSGTTVSISLPAEAGATAIWDIRERPSLVDTVDYIWSRYVGHELIVGRVNPEDEAGPFELRVWEAGRSELLRFGPGPGPADMVASSPGGRWSVHPVRLDGRVHVFERPSGPSVVVLDELGEAAPAGASPDEFTVWDVEFAPDSSRMIATIEHGAAAMWDTETWQLVALFDGDDAVRDVAYTPDGELLYALDFAGRLTIRDPETLEVLVGPVVAHDSIAHGGKVVAVSDNGRVAVTSGSGGAQLWDATTLEPIGEPFPHFSPALYSAELASAADRVVTMDGDRIVVWDADVDEWATIACRAAGRNLTESEWEQFGPADSGYRATCPELPSVA